MELEHEDEYDGEEGEESEAVATDDEAPVIDPYADLRRMRRSISEDKSQTLDIPGYHGRLVVKLRKLTHPEVDKINKRVANLREKHNPNANLIGQVDALVEATTGIYLRKDLNDRSDEGLESLNVGYGEDGDGEATWLDAARVVLDDDKQLPPQATQRDALRAVIGNDLAITPMHIEYQAWARTLIEEEEEDFTPSF